MSEFSSVQVPEVKPGACTVNRLSSSSHAETSAGKSSIPTQESSTTTSPEQTIGRTFGDQGNTSTEKSLDKPLTYEQKVAIIRAAIDKDRKGRIPEWGIRDLSRLINHYEKDASSPGQWTSFFTELLFFIAKPEISPAFHNSLPNGLQKISKLLDFFTELNNDYDDYAAWCDYWFVEYDFVISEFDFRNIAEVWLEGAELTAVVGSDRGVGSFDRMREVEKKLAGKTPKTLEDVAKATPTVLGPDTIIQFRWDQIKHQPFTTEPKEKKSFAIQRSPLPMVTTPLKLSGKSKPATKIAGGAVTKKAPASKPTSIKKPTTKKKA